MIASVPAPVADRRAAVAPTAAKRRTGLLPMEPGSQHKITITIDGVPTTAIVTARAHEDVRRAKTRHICLNDRCVDKSWDSLDAMTASHPQRVAMAKNDEVHVYGLWSDDPQAEGPRKVAEAALKEAQETYDAACALLKGAKTVGDKAFAVEEKASSNLALIEARKALAAVSGCVGLIAPPDRGGDE